MLASLSICDRTNDDDARVIGQCQIVAKVYDIDPRKARALELLLEGQPTGAVALACGANRATIWRWRTQDPAFQTALASRSSERLEDVRAELESAAVAASSYLRAVAEGEPADQGRIAACRLVLERAVPPTHADPSGREASQKALQAAMGGESEARRFIGEQVASALGFTSKAGA